jgi:hypothetical protein
MGARPQQPDYAGMARSAVNDALEKQKELAKDILARAETYETKRETSQAELDKMFGRTGTQARTEYEKRFATEIPSLRGEFEAKQKYFSPGVLDTETVGSSFNRLANVLRGSAGEYTSGMDLASTKAQSRLYETLAAPIAGFEAIANRPSFNKLYDPTYMELAKKPPTVTSDVDSFRQLYTYNV